MTGSCENNWEQVYGSRARAVHTFEETRIQTIPRLYEAILQSMAISSNASDMLHMRRSLRILPLCADTQVNLRARLGHSHSAINMRGRVGGWQPLQQNTCRGYFLDEGVITPVTSRLTSFTRGWSGKDDHHHKWVVRYRATSQTCGYQVDDHHEYQPEMW